MPMLTFALTAAALALPPSSTLAGPTGTLSWTVTAAAGGVHVEGRSPAWTVSHDAAADLTPKRTVRTEKGVTVTVEYRADGATIRFPDDVIEVRHAGLWDGDTLDVRLGQEVARGRKAFGFAALDPATGDAYDFTVEHVGSETCGPTACEHERVRLAGVLRYVGPTFDFWYAADGRLLRFTGPIGSFQAG